MIQFNNHSTTLFIQGSRRVRGVKIRIAGSPAASLSRRADFSQVRALTTNPISNAGFVYGLQIGNPVFFIISALIILVIAWKM